MADKLPDIKTQFSEWYQDVITQAELTDQAPVRGCMVMRPYGYAIWENIQKNLDARIKAQGYQNCAFPLLIPESFLQQEKSHVEGFAPEVAVVTHAGGSELEEKLVIRPTSETIIHHMFSRWIHSWRDLPMKVNQWCSVIRWEMRPRPFLRTTEFWWHECHAAHATREEAHADLIAAHYHIYKNFIEHDLAIPVITGAKSVNEQFAGADLTMTHEGVMQDGKALQMATSHMISQSFAKAFAMQFQDDAGIMQYPYLSSFGATTRLIGAVIMVHGDQKGLVLPPAIAPYHIVITPIIKATNKERVLAHAESIKARLDTQFRVHIDATLSTPGAKFYHWEVRGVPIRIEVGERDIESNVCICVERIDGSKTSVTTLQQPEKQTGTHTDVLQLFFAEKLESIRLKMFTKASAMQESWRARASDIAEFGPRIEEHGGVIQSGWCGSSECEKALKQYKATIRCLSEEKSCTSCCVCKKPSITDCIIAKSY